MAKTMIQTQKQRPLKRHPRSDAAETGLAPDARWTRGGRAWSLSVTAQRPRRRIEGANIGRVCVLADIPSTMRRAAGLGCWRIF
jgi:hypothetical protein